MKRPASFPPENGEAQTSKRLKSKLRMPQTPKRKAKPSALFKLPNEIIEQIFLINFEFNFPRASPVLGAILSREAVYRCVLLRAFWLPGTLSTLASRQAPSKDLAKFFLPGPVPDPEMSIEERAGIQKEAMDCRWCTFTRLKSIYPLLLQIQIQTSFYDRFAGGDFIPSAQAEVEAYIMELAECFPEQPSRLFRSFSLLSSSDPQLCELGFAPILTLTWPCDIHVRLAKNVDTEDAFTSGRCASFDNNNNSLRGYHRPFQILNIPESLLVAEVWTEERVEYLRFLRILLYSKVKDLHSTTWDQIQIGIKNAISCRNYRALTHLLELNEINELRQNPEVYPILDGENFVLAAEMQDITAFVCCLRSNSTAVPAANRTIIQWAFQVLRHDKNHYRRLFGIWLSSFLPLIPSRQNQRDILFYRGGPAKDRPMHLLTLRHDEDDVLAAELEELCNLKFENWDTELGYYGQFDPLSPLAYPEPGRYKLPYKHLEPVEIKG